MNYLPSKLLKLRKHYNYSQEHIAKTLGISVEDYMAIENGREVLNYLQCKKIANLYHIGTVDIFRNSDEVTLYEVSKAKTDELNIEYFLPEKTFFEKIGSFIKKNPIIVGVSLGVVILGVITIMVFGNNETTPYEAKLTNINRLSVSNTTVVYIANDGSLKGAGDNSNGQLSNLPSSNIIKVGEGSSFTVYLKNDGTVEGIGLTDTYEKEIEKWKNIVDIGCGKNHIVGVNLKGDVFACGDNTYGQCDVDDFKNIQKVFVGDNSTIVYDKDGNLDFCGEFVGSSQLKTFKNVLDIDTSNNNIVFCTDQNKVEYLTSSGNYLDVYKWNDVIDVTCGDNFIAGLRSDGSVVVDSEDQGMKKDVEAWSNIIAIDAGDNYLIGFDGKEIFGTGKNNYHQFKQEVIEKSSLPQVSGVNIDVGTYIVVSFDRVDNAEGYEIRLESKTPITYKVNSNQAVSFDTNELEDGMNYKIVITTLGDGSNYLDSLPLEVEFIFNSVNKEDNEFVSIDKEFVGMSKDDFLSYIKSLGFDEMNLIEVESGNECQDDVPRIISVDGISVGVKISKRDLKNAKVTYTCCRIQSEEVSEETPDE